MRYHVLASHHMCGNDDFDAHLNVEQLSKNMKTLSDMYDDSYARDSPDARVNEPEFRACVVHKIYAPQPPLPRLAPTLTGLTFLLSFFVFVRFMTSLHSCHLFMFRCATLESSHARSLAHRCVRQIRGAGQPGQPRSRGGHAQGALTFGGIVARGSLRAGGPVSRRPRYKSPLPSVCGKCLCSHSAHV